MPPGAACEHSVYPFVSHREMLVASLDVLQPVAALRGAVIAPPMDTRSKIRCVYSVSQTHHMRRREAGVNKATWLFPSDVFRCAKVHFCFWSFSCRATESFVFSMFNLGLFLVPSRLDRSVVVLGAALLKGTQIKKVCRSKHKTHPLGPRGAPCEDSSVTPRGLRLRAVFFMLDTEREESRERCRRKRYWPKPATTEHGVRRITTWYIEPDVSNQCKTGNQCRKDWQSR